MAEPDVAPAGGARNPALGRPRVTVRPHYEGPPFNGLDGTGRAERKLRARAGEEPVVRVPEATVPGTQNATMERCEAGARAQRARRRKASADGCASRRSIPSGFPGGKEMKALPAPFKQQGRRSVG